MKSNVRVEERNVSLRQKTDDMIRRTQRGKNRLSMDTCSLSSGTGFNEMCSFSTRNGFTNIIIRINRTIMRSEDDSQTRIQTACLLVLVAVCIAHFWLRPVLVPLVVAFFVVSGITQFWCP